MERFHHILLLLIVLCAVGIFPMQGHADGADTCHTTVSRVGIEVSPSYILPTNGFLRGDNSSYKTINAALGANLRYDFSYTDATLSGRLYRGVYSGVGTGMKSFFSTSLLGNPVAVYIYQGAPIVRLSERLRLGYEWNLGIATGWKKYHGDIYGDGDGQTDTNVAIGSRATAYIGLGIFAYYMLGDNWQLHAGVEGSHYSNGNTEYPNGGINAVGLRAGVTYVINPPSSCRCRRASANEIADANRGAWQLDVMAYGAWRKRIVSIESQRQLLRGHFGVAGVQIAPMRKINRYFSTGVSVDLQYDESSNLPSHAIDVDYGSEFKFTRPAFHQQILAGLSAHAELTMPIFTINAGLGYNLICPESERRFYQSLALKAFVIKGLYLHVGYRLSDFQSPNNLMLGIGYRIR